MVQIRNQWLVKIGSPWHLECFLRMRLYMYMYMLVIRTAKGSHWGVVRRHILELFTKHIPWLMRIQVSFNWKAMSINLQSKMIWDGENTLTSSTRFLKTLDKFKLNFSPKHYILLNLIFFFLRTQLKIQESIRTALQEFKG